jgi:hypothetical protein
MASFILRSTTPGKSLVFVLKEAMWNPEPVRTMPRRDTFLPLSGIEPRSSRPQSIARLTDSPSYHHDKYRRLIRYLSAGNETSGIATETYAAPRLVIGSCWQPGVLCHRMRHAFSLQYGGGGLVKFNL